MPDGSRFHVDDPRFGGPRQQADDRPAAREPGQPSYRSPEPPAKRRSAFSTCLIGCLITLVMLSAVAAVGLWWFFQNWRDLASSMGADVMKNMVETTDLPEGEKADIGLQVDRLADAVREGRLSGEQLGAIFEDVMESPLVTMLVASAIENKYLAGSGLDDGEKDEARQTLRRFLRGLVDNKIPEAGVDHAMKHVATRQNKQEPWQLKESVTDEELRNFLREAKAQADDAAIPEESEDIDPSDEFERIIDEAMQAP